MKQLLTVHPTGRVSGDVHYGELQLEKGGVIAGTLCCVSDQRETVEPVLGKTERPKVIHRNDALRAVNGNGYVNGVGLHGMLPPADYRAAS